MSVLYVTHRSTYQGIVSYKIKTQLSKSTFVKLALYAMVLGNCEHASLCLAIHGYLAKHPAYVLLPHSNLPA